MKNFTVKSFSLWATVNQDKLFVYPSQGEFVPQTISGEYICDKDCRVFVGTDPKMSDRKLVACGSGHVSFKVSCPPRQGVYYLGFDSSSDHLVFKSGVVDQTLAKSQAPSFARIAPKRKELSPEIKEALGVIEAKAKERTDKLLGALKRVSGRRKSQRSAEPAQLTSEDVVDDTASDSAPDPAV